MRRPVPFQSTSRLVARGLGMAADSLAAAFRPARFDDVDALVALRRQGIDADIDWDDAAYLAWRYRLGRAGEGLGDLWVFRDGGEVLGMIGTQDCALACGTHRFSGLQVMDVLVHPRVADAGLGIWMNQALFQRNEFVLAVGANANSHGIVTRLFSHQLARSAYAYPIDLGSYVARRLGSDRVGQPLGQAAGWVLGAWHALRRPRLPAGIDIRPLARFSQDDLETLLAHAPAGNEISIEWRAPVLNHRLFDNPRARYDVTSAWQQGECIGYVAARVVQRREARPYIHLIDWRLPAADTAAVFGELLAGLVAQGRRQGCSLILTDVLHAPSEALLSASGFRQGRPLPFKIVGLHTEQPRLGQLGIDAARWRITDIASDVDGL